MIFVMVVQGTLEFDRTDIRLDAHYIFVMDGSFIVGTEQDPFLQSAIITLHGGPVQQEIPICASHTVSIRRPLAYEARCCCSAHAHHPDVP